jgi:hypothetical protein
MQNQMALVLDDLVQKKWARLIIGVQLSYLRTGEWFFRWDPLFAHPGSLRDPYLPMYNAGARAAFCKYLENHASNLGCELPTAAQRTRGTFGNLLDGSTPAARRSVHFNQFISERVVDAISKLSAWVKHYSGRRLLTLTFYGYQFELMRNLPNLSASGHLALAKLLADPNVDAITAPYSYGRARQLSHALYPHDPMDSPALHGKLWIHEDDSRTHLAADQESAKTVGDSQQL